MNDFIKVIQLDNLFLNDFKERYVEENCDLVNELVSVSPLINFDMMLEKTERLILKYTVTKLRFIF
jgi:hypothetical protein